MRISVKLALGTLMALCLSPVSARAQTSVQQSQVHEIASVYVGDRFKVEVHLPVSYSSSEKHYPVLVVLDADKSSGMARDIVDWLSWSSEIPELIVVGISYGGSVKEWWQKRSRDLTPSKDPGKIWGEFPLAGGAEAFSAFIREELLPLVEGAYRASSDRTLAGMSFGGLFGTYMLFAEPQLFHRYILASPALAWDKERMWQYEKHYRAEHSQLDAIVFTAVGSLDEQVILEPWKRFNTLIEERGYSGLTWQAHSFDGETHISCWPLALSRGLREVFATQ